MMTDSENIQAWDNFAFTTVVSNRSIPEPVIDLLKFKFPNGGLMLEIGCGTASWFHAFQDLGFKCEGVEQAPTAVEIARHVHMDSPIYHARIQEFWLKDKYDLVFSSAVLMHNTHPRKKEILKIIYNTLKPRGHLLIRENMLTNPDEYSFDFNGWRYFIESEGFTFTNAVRPREDHHWVLFQKND